MTDQELMQSTTEEQVFWLECVKGLPPLQGFSGTGYDAAGVRIPWGSGPHNLKDYRRIVDKVQPKSILEIGFGLGYSSAVWLALCDCCICSIDVSNKAETMAAAAILEKRYPQRFLFLLMNSKQVFKLLLDSSFDMIFIDGNHEEDYVTSDIQLAIDKHIPWIVLDDWQPNFGPGVQIAARKFNLEVVEVYGNTALCRQRL